MIGFNVRPDGGARRAAETNGVQCRYYKVIYEALDEIAAAAKGLLEPTIEEQHRASIEVRKVFTVPKVGAIAGCMVIDGKVARGQKTRLLRDSIIIWEGSLSSLKRFKDDVKEVEKGYECGIGLENYNDIKKAISSGPMNLLKFARFTIGFAALSWCVSDISPETGVESEGQEVLIGRIRERVRSRYNVSVKKRKLKMAEAFGDGVFDRWVLKRNASTLDKLSNYVDSLYLAEIVAKMCGLRRWCP